MNLQEDINRIKEVMGINEASMNPYLLRRIPEFVRAIIDIAEAIYVRSDREYSEMGFRNFLDRAIFGSVRDVIGSYDLTHDELKKLEIILSRIINDDRDLLQTLKQIYISKLDLGLMNEGDTPISIRRRLPELIDSVFQSAEFYNPNIYSAPFNEFLERVIYAGIVTEFPDDYFDSDATKLEYLEDLIKKIILNDKKLLKKMQSIYEKRSKLKKEGINESTVYLKRRMPELIDAVITAADWYMPSFMPDFQTYLDRAIYSGIISVVPMDYADTHVREMEELEDGLRNFIKSDKELLEKFVALYTRGAKKYVAW
jgi:hypothetical protein